MAYVTYYSANMKNKRILTFISFYLWREYLGAVELRTKDC